MRISDWSSDVCSSDLRPGNVIHLSNLCTEILEVTSAEETAVCNLGSINLSHHVDEDGPAGTSVFDYDKLGETVRLAVRQLDRVIDLNFYPIESARRGNLRWRPVGLGVMGPPDAFFKLRLPFDGEQARPVERRVGKGGVRTGKARWG